MTTTRRSWTKRVAEIRTAARTCRAYESDSGNMVPIDPARAFEAWERTPRARLTEDTPGQKWTVHVHSNQFYVLTTEKTAAPADNAAGAEAPAASPTAPPGLRHTRQAAGPAGAQDHGAARTMARGRGASGTPGRDRLPTHVPAMAGDLVGKTVRVKLAQGYSHGQIREEFEHERAKAETAGDAGRARAWERRSQCTPRWRPRRRPPSRPPAPPSPTPAAAPRMSGNSSGTNPSEGRAVHRLPTRRRGRAVDARRLDRPGVHRLQGGVRRPGTPRRPVHQDLSPHGVRGTSGHRSRTRTRRTTWRKRTPPGPKCAPDSASALTEDESTRHGPFFAALRRARVARHP
ncbi:hypothetical protein ACFVT5_42910 [Streptomyces sp. NPDC058001]|uniref:hypothetical protein n=1 Tax=Streptomyces sp. NPDC058001 TaxID=3346300 RepID=UPI0036F185D5